MNCPGWTSPRVGWCQRTSASIPATRAVAQPHDRLEVQLELARRRSRAAARPAARAARARARASRPRRPGSRPCRRACRCTSPRRRCGSARPRRRASASASVPLRAMPMLGRTDRSLSDDARSASRTRATRRSARSSAAAGSPTSSSRIGELVAAEARGGVGRADGLDAGARPTCCSTSSPAAWPRLSLIVLKSSRSRKMTATARAPRARRARARAATRSENSARFGRPVTASWNAWCASCCLERLALAGRRGRSARCRGRARRRAGRSRRPRTRAARPSRDRACTRTRAIAAAVARRLHAEQLAAAARGRLAISRSSNEVP